MRLTLVAALLLLPAFAAANEDTVRIAGEGHYLCLPHGDGDITHESRRCEPRASPTSLGHPHDDLDHFTIFYEGPNFAQAEVLSVSDEGATASYEGVVSVTEDAPGLLHVEISGVSFGEPWSCTGRGPEGRLAILCELPRDAVAQTLDRSEGLFDASWVGARYAVTRGAGEADVCRRTCEDVA